MTYRIVAGVYCIGLGYIISWSGADYSRIPKQCRTHCGFGAFLLPRGARSIFRGAHFRLHTRFAGFCFGLQVCATLGGFFGVKLELRAEGSRICL